MPAWISSRSRARRVEERHAQDRRVARHRLARIDLDAPAVADHDDAPVRREDVEIAIEVHVGEHLEHDVHASPPVSGSTRCR